jgi:hypothetical protein
MKTTIINGYWSNKQDEINSERQIAEHIKNNTTQKVYVGNKKVSNFKVTTDIDGSFIVYYALRGDRLKYYFRLLGARSIAVNGGTIVNLFDTNWKDYENKILTQETINILTNNYPCQ